MRHEPDRSVAVLVVDVANVVGRGDDEVVAQVERRAATGPVTVVTADRGLRERLPETADVMSPSELLRHMSR